MRLRRLMSIGIPELAGRGRQEGRRWLERARLAVVGPRSEDVLNLVGDRAASAGLLEGFLTHAPARFFEGAVSPATPDLISERAPESRERTLAEAERIARARFDLLGYSG